MLFFFFRKGTLPDRSPFKPLSPLWFTLLLCVLLLVTLLLGNRVEAATVISEVHWAGSDLSSADEWVEVTSTDVQSSSMSGWTLTSLSSGGAEKVIFQFPPGSSVRGGEYLVISHYGAAQSRLLSEPAFIAPSMSLPNSQLLLKLKDAAGIVIDQADDGSGAPFAGKNDSAKASMERVDFSIAGTIPGNWITSTASVGWSDGPMVMYGSPGGPFVHSTISSSSVSSSSSPQAGMPAPNVNSSCPSLDPYFIIQSGQTSGEEKVTLNLQIGVRQGSLSGASCVVDFDDGTTSASCNPPSHTFDEPGSYVISAEIKTSCTNITRTLPIEVTSKTSSSSSSNFLGLSNTGAERLVLGPFIISGVLPNPSGKDPGNEWIEITNTSAQTANLEGWSLRLPHAKKNTFTFGMTGFFLGETKRFSDAELGMSFKNENAELSLLNSGGQTVMTVSWKDAKEGIVQRPLRAAPSGTLRGRVVSVIDGDTVEAQMLEGILRTERIRMIGIDAPEMHSKDAGKLMLGRRSADFLRDLVSGTIVTLTFGAEERDTYGRLLAYLEDEEGDSIQEQLLREGMASVYLRYPFAKEAEFIGYQREAQEANAGMWGILQYEGDEKRVTSDPTSSALAGFAGQAGNELRVTSDEMSSRSSSSRPRTVLVARVIQHSSASSRAASSAKPKKVAASKSVKKSVHSSSAPEEEETMSPFNSHFDPLRELIDVPEASAAVSFEQPQEFSNRSFPLVTITIALALCGIAGCAGGWFLVRSAAPPRATRNDT